MRGGLALLGPLRQDLATDYPRSRLSKLKSFHVTIIKRASPHGRFGKTCFALRKRQKHTSCIVKLKMAASIENVNSKSKQLPWTSDMVNMLINALNIYKMEFRNIDFDGERPRRNDEK